MIRLLVALLAATAGDASAQTMSAELDVVRHVQSSGLLSQAGEYVMYDLTVRNTGTIAIEDQQLWVRFASGKTDSFASFSITYIAPGESRQFQLGPFKMPESGDYNLFLGINSEGRPDFPDSVALDRTPGQGVDTITAYHPAVATLLPAGAGIAAAGAALTAWHLARKSRPQK